MFILPTIVDEQIASFCLELEELNRRGAFADVTENTVKTTSTLLLDHTKLHSVCRAHDNVRVAVDFERVSTQLAILTDFSDCYCDWLLLEQHTSSANHMLASIRYDGRRRFVLKRMADRLLQRLLKRTTVPMPVSLGNEEALTLEWKIGDVTISLDRLEARWEVGVTRVHQNGAVLVNSLPYDTEEEAFDAFAVLVRENA